MIIATTAITAIKIPQLSVEVVDVGGGVTSAAWPVGVGVNVNMFVSVGVGVGVIVSAWLVTVGVGVDEDAFHPELRETALGLPARRLDVVHRHRADGPGCGRGGHSRRSRRT